MSQEATVKRFGAGVWYKNWLDFYHRTLQVHKDKKKHESTPLPDSEVYVCFRGGVHTQWQRFLDEDFTHVFMLSDIINQRFGKGLLQTEFLHSHISTVHLPLASVSEYIESLKGAGVSVVKVKRGSRRIVGSLWPTMVPFNCVSLVKHFLGIKKRTVLTPKQLYMYLSSQSR